MIKESAMSQPHRPPAGSPLPPHGYYGPEYAVLPKRSKREPFLWAVIVVLLAAVAVLAILYAIEYENAHKTKAPTSPVQSPGVTSLSHTAVENYIESALHVSAVVCNNGHDFPMTADGATFTCRGADGAAYTVTITDKDRGNYSVRRS